MGDQNASWGRWFQSHFTVLSLLFLLVISLSATIALMHEEKIEDKYVTWLEGWDSGIFAALTLGMTSDRKNQPPEDESSTTVKLTKTETPEVKL